MLKREIQVEKSRRDNLYVIRLSIQQTDGIWDSGSAFSLQVYLTGPYLKYTFLSGYTASMPLFNLRTTDSSPAAAAQGIIELTTTTPPKDEPIILEIESEKEVSVDHVLATPTDLSLIHI